MEILRIIIGLRKKSQTGPGVPRGLVMELRAVAVVALGIALGLAGWWWGKHLEKQAYFGKNSAIEKIPTAVGRP